MTREQDEALSIARRLASAGIPIFIANPASNKTGFTPPSGWQNTVADPSVVDLWRPGLALCACMGSGLDLIDIDPRNGGTLNDEIDAVVGYGLVATPSGGVHKFIKSLDAGSRDNLFPGVDVKGGRSDGTGRGFVFLAPTVRASAVDGVERAYTWIQGPSDWGVEDSSGGALAAKISSLVGVRSVAVDSPDWWQEFVSNSGPQSIPAAQRAVANKIASVVEFTGTDGEGFRTVLMRAAITIGGYVAAGVLEESEAQTRLEEAVSSVWGAPDQDDLLWIQQGLTDGQARPFNVYSAADLLAMGFSDAEITDEELWTFYNAIGDTEFRVSGGTDQEYADCVLDRIYPGMRFAVDAGTWLIRKKELWSERPEGASSAVSALARLMPLGDGDLPTRKADYTAENWVAVRRAKFMNSGTAASIERKMRSVVQIPGHAGGLDLSALDMDPHILWAGGVAWDLKASSVVPTPAGWVPLDTPHMHSALVAPDAGVATPLWDAFVAAVWPDPDIRAWALRVLSVAITGYPDAALPILYGRERSGKTSLVEMLLDVLGTYGRPANAKLLGDNKDHDTIVYELKGARLAFIDEGPRKGYDATERLKQLTGGSKLTGRPMRANPIAFTPTHTLVMTTNNEPQLTDPALRARARLIPCNTDEVVVRPLRQALLDAAVLKAEAPGILARMMREAALWLADRNSATIGAAPDSIKGMALEIAEGQDPVREWVLDCTIPTDPGTPGRQLYSQFATWHQGSALYRRSAVPSETHFGRTLSDMGYPAVKTKGAWYRPLSSLGGPNYPHVVPTPTAYLAGIGPGGGSAAGSGGVPANPETPRSGGVSTTLSGGLAGLLHTSLSQKETEGNRALSTNPTEETCDLSRQAANSPEIGPLPAEAPLASTSATSPTSRQGPEKPTKAQIKAQEKEAARLEAVAEASGEILTLPAVVDRAGNVLPINEDQAATVVRSCLARTQGALTVDVETSGYPVGHRDYKLRSVQLGDEIASVVLCPQWNRQIIEDLLDEAKTLHAHSASADLVPLAVAGLIDIDSGWARMFDTVIPAKLGDPQSTGSDPGLKKLAMAVLGDEATAPGADADREKVFKAGKWLTRAKSDTPVERNGWSQIETGCKTMLRYAASDVLDTAMLAKRLPPVPGNVLARERIAEEMTARVGYTGLQIDHGKVLELTERHIMEQGKAELSIRKFGIDNPGSGKQLSEVLKAMGAQLPVSAKGNPSVAEHVLSVLKRDDSDAGRLAQDVLDYRKSSTALNLFLEPYRLICELGDSRARPTIYTLGTDTGRMSCVRPNFQQLPREGGVRSVVVADPGMCFVSADFSGVELRGAAALSQDPTMMHMIREEDEGRFDGFHWAVARQAFGPDATYAQRYIAKRGVFGHIYGGGVTTLAQQVGVPEEEMRAIVESLKVLTPGLAAWSNNVRQAVRQGHTQFPSYGGRIIHFPRDYPHKAPNYAIQGSCREVLVDALIKWRDTKWGKATCLPIHDELIMMVPSEDAHEATTALVSCMESELYGVKIVAEPSEPSTYWQDAA